MLASGPSGVPLNRRKLVDKNELANMLRNYLEIRVGNASTEPYDDSVVIQLWFDGELINEDCLY